MRGFTPGDLIGSRESFRVKGIQFSYYAGILSGGFNRTASLGGPIHEGLHVRIWYEATSSPFVADRIVKLEVCP